MKCSVSVSLRGRMIWCLKYNKVYQLLSKNFKLCIFFKFIRFYYPSSLIISVKIGLHFLLILMVYNRIFPHIYIRNLRFNSVSKSIGVLLSRDITCWLIIIFRGKSYHQNQIILFLGQGIELKLCGVAIQHTNHKHDHFHFYHYIYRINVFQQINCEFVLWMCHCWRSYKHEIFSLLLLYNLDTYSWTLITEARKIKNNNQRINQR